MERTSPALSPSPAQALLARCLPELAVPTEGQADAAVAAWARTVLRWCHTLCDARVHPEDACQEVLILLFERPPAAVDDDEVRRWLWGVTWRVVKAQQRRAWVRRWLPGASEPDHWLDQLPGRDGPTDQDRAVKQVLDRLPLDQRRLLWLAYVEGATRSELAEHLGLPEGTVNRRLTAARAAFDAAARAAGLAPEEVPGG
ncbi:MAG: sigma-70 family RNA polymerase sigma factor [Alphaproteobacteria bacterium]|nr:sigma-70 family RNA polymerase sigma factor [Alphaproteobacteria bacterium]